jgi:hypothetical protein
MHYFLPEPNSQGGGNPYTDLMHGPDKSVWWNNEERFPAAPSMALQLNPID